MSEAGDAGTAENRRLRVSESRPRPPQPRTAPLPRTLKLRIVDGAVEYPTFEFRFLFTNGDVLDVVGIGDDETLRAAVLAERRIDGDQIAGVSEGRFVGWARVGSRRRRRAVSER
jgi:hypothetical protein